VFCSNNKLFSIVILVNGANFRDCKYLYALVCSLALRCGVICMISTLDGGGIWLKTCLLQKANYQYEPDVGHSIVQIHAIGSHRCGLDGIIHIYMFLRCSFAKRQYLGVGNVVYDGIIYQMHSFDRVVYRDMASHDIGFHTRTCIAGREMRKDSSISLRSRDTKVMLPLASR
jgi:hypothetical protein